MGWWNDNNAFIRGNGNLTLGLAGKDDAAYDATHTYAKNDFWAHVSPVLLPLGIPTTTLTELNVRNAAGQYERQYTAGGAITPKLALPLSMYLPFHRTLTGTTSTSAPHGFKLLDLILNYKVATADATSVAVVFNTETPQANATARSAASTTPLGTITYQNPLGTVVATLPVAQQATPYVNRIVLGTPAFVNTDRSTLTAEIQLSLPNTCVFTITDIALHFALAAY